MLMISCDPSKFFLTQDRIEVYLLANIAREVVKESEVFDGFVKLHDNAKFNIDTWFVEKKSG